MKREHLLDDLERALDLVAGPGDPDLPDHLRDLIRALYFELRRYRDALTHVTDETAR